MFRPFLVFAVGALFGWGVIGFIAPLPRTGDRAIEEMKKVRPGMSLQQVEAALGRKPSYLSRPGETVGTEASAQFPGDYWQEHGLQTYLVQGMGPYLLFVAFDRSERVTFVSFSAT